MPDQTPTTRLAPSPSGALHLGNLRTFAINWALARQRGERVLMRVEDLNTPTARPGIADAMLDTLAWLGFAWDEQTPRQSADLTPYHNAMAVLAQRGAAYPCELTRDQIDAASQAPHAEDDAEPAFPIELRPELRARPFDDPHKNWRMVVPPAGMTRGPVLFDDLFAGRAGVDPATVGGDFPVWTRRGAPSYQLAVVIDDHRQGVTHVVRGDDLIPSTSRQIALAHALGIEFNPRYTHLPLVVGPDGRRLAKRHGDTRLETYRERGVPPEAFVGLIAAWSGVGAPDQPEPMPLVEFADAFSLDALPRDPIVFRPEHDRWLLSCAR